jgi:SAM-dependent methyltransferase
MTTTATQQTTCEGDVLIKKDGSEIIRCRPCGYAHVHPFYSNAELEAFYKDHYGDSTPSPNWREKVLNTLKVKSKGSILDIGCWDGTQLGYFAKEGWACTGTELNVKAGQEAASKGIEVLPLTFQNLFSGLKGRRWDVVNASFILEHLQRPEGFLKQLQDLLNPGGILIAEVPNEFSPYQLAHLKNKGIEPYWIYLPDHVNYFDIPGIEGLLERTGWTIFHAESTFPMEQFLLMGDDYIVDKPSGKVSFQKVVRMEATLREYDETLLPRLYEAMYKVGVGRSVILYARRTDDKAPLKP